MEYIGGAPKVYIATPKLEENERNVFLALWGDHGECLTVLEVVSKMAEHDVVMNDEAMLGVLEVLAEKGLLLELNSSGTLMYDRSGFGARVAKRLCAGVCFLPSERQYAEHIKKCRCARPEAPPRARSAPPARNLDEYEQSLRD